MCSVRACRAPAKSQQSTVHANFYCVTDSTDSRLLSFRRSCHLPPSVSFLSFFFVYFLPLSIPCPLSFARFFFLSCHRRSVVLYLSPLPQTIPYTAKFNSGKSCHCRSAASFVIVYQRSCTGDSNR